MYSTVYEQTEPAASAQISPVFLLSLYTIDTRALKHNIYIDVEGWSEENNQRMIYKKQRDRKPTIGYSLVCTFLVEPASLSKLP